MPIRRRRRPDPTARPGAGRDRRGGDGSTDGSGNGSHDGSGVVIGVVGRPLRATVAPSGDVTPWPDPTARRSTPTTLTWHVAADDRWHLPSSEPTVRQRRIDGTPVVETRVRIPDGDAVQRAWASADAGGLIVVEVENESPLPFAVAFSGARLLTSRPPADVPVEGIDLPDDTVVLPVGHRSTVRVALAPDAEAGRLPAVSDAAAVVRGWRAVADAASRLELPDPALGEAVTAARCDLLLEGPVDASADPLGFVLDARELVRLGDDAATWLPEIIDPVEAITRRGVAGSTAAVEAAALVAERAGDRRAAGDIRRIRERSPAETSLPAASFAAVRRGASAGRFVHAVESLLAAGGELLPAGLPTAWLGHDWAAHGVPTGPGSSVSYAIRWHGDRPAILWEQTGNPTTLTAGRCAPGWSTAEPSGEALWPAPPARSSLSVTAG